MPAMRNKFSTFFTKQVTIEAICCLIFYAIFNLMVLMKPNKAKVAIFTIDFSRWIIIGIKMACTF